MKDGKKGDGRHVVEGSDLLESEAPVRIRTTDARRIRKVSPLGMRVLVAIRREPNQTDSGLYLPEGAKTNMQESLLAEVLEVASACDAGSEDEETNISGIPQGSLVLIPKNAGTKIPWDEERRIVDSKDILAIVNELSLV